MTCCRGRLGRGGVGFLRLRHCRQNDADAEILDQNVRISRGVITNRALFKHVRAVFRQWDSKLVIINLTAAIRGILVFLAVDRPALFVPRDE